VTDRSYAFVGAALRGCPSGARTAPLAVSSRTGPRGPPRGPSHPTSNRKRIHARERTEEMNTMVGGRRWRAALLPAAFLCGAVVGSAYRSERGWLPAGLDRGHLAGARLCGRSLRSIDL